MLVVENDPTRLRLGSQHEILGHRKRRHQHEVLVDNADSRRYRLICRPSRHIAAVDLDVSRVRLHQAAEYAHERRFAGAVLADEGVDLARHHLHRRAAIRSDGAERFVDPVHPDRGDNRGGLRSSAAGHLVLGTLMRPAIISCLSSSTRACTLSGMSARLRLS